MSELIGPPCPYRAVGYTWKAGFFPLTPEGQAIIAKHNGVPVDKLPRGARYAPNADMLRWIEKLASVKAVQTDGRWPTISEIET